MALYYDDCVLLWDTMNKQKVKAVTTEEFIDYILKTCHLPSNRYGKMVTSFYKKYKKEKMEGLK